MKAIYKEEFDEWLKSQDAYDLIDRNPLLRAVAETAWEGAKKHSKSQQIFGDENEQLLTALNFASQLGKAIYENLEPLLHKTKSENLPKR